jgi:hypothetical protein
MSQRAEGEKGRKGAHKSYCIRTKPSIPSGSPHAHKSRRRSRSSIKRLGAGRPHANMSCVSRWPVAATLAALRPSK